MLTAPTFFVHSVVKVCTTAFQPISIIRAVIFLKYSFEIRGEFEFSCFFCTFFVSVIKVCTSAFQVILIIRTVLFIWVYVVLSRVRTLNNLVLNEKLYENRKYNANNELVRWETRIKETIEKKTFKDRGRSDYNKYLNEENKYKGSLP